MIYEMHSIMQTTQNLNVSKFIPGMEGASHIYLGFISSASQC